MADPQVTTTPANANVNNAPGTSANWTTLTDGLLPTVDPNPAGILSVVAPNSNDEVVFHLDVAGNGGLGFNITSFDSYCHWNDGGRNDQRYTLYYSVVGDETNFINIGSVTNNAGEKSTHSRVYDTTGVLATNVAAFKVHFDGQENNWAGYSEFILSADPLVPAPVQVINVNESMSGPPAWTLPAGTNLLDGAAATSTPALQSPPPNSGNAVSTSWATMTNGSIGNSTDDPACVAPFSGGSVVFPLKNLGVNTKGYDLTAMDFYCAWADSGRDDMHFAVSYATFDAPGTFIPLSNVDNFGEGNSSTHTRLTPGSGFLAKNVVAIKLNFRDQENGWVGYREFIALGTPSPINPPLTWTGSTSGIWNTTANNWTAPYDSLSPLNLVQAASNKTISVPAPITASSMTFSHTSSPPYAFSGSQITVSNNITSTGSGAATFANVVKAADVVLSGGGSLTFNSDLESDGLELSGSGSITLNADNDNAGTPLFTGTAGVSGGTLNVSNNLAVKAAALAMTGGTANFTTAAPSVALLGGTGGTVNLNATALTVGTGSLANQNASFSGNIAQASGSGSFIKDGASSLTLSGVNTYTGITRVKGGTLQFATRPALYNGNTGAWTSSNLVVDSGAILGFNAGAEFSESDLNGLGMGGFASGSRLGITTSDFSPTENFTLSRNVTGGVGFYKKGASILTLTGTNTGNGVTTISAGSLVAAGSGHATLPGDVHMGDGSNNSVYMALGANNQFGPTSVLHMNNPTFNGANTKLQLRGTNQTIAGLDSPATAYISIIQNDDSTVPDFVAAATAGASVTIDTQGNSYSFRGIIRNQDGPAVSLTKNGLGTQELINLSGIQGYGYTGPTTVNGGTLRLNFARANSEFASDVTVTSPATFNLHSAVDGYDFNRTISGSGKLLVTGGNPVALTQGNNSWTGGTTVDGGFFALKTVNGLNIGSGDGPGQTCIAGIMDPSNVINVINGGTFSLDEAAALGNSPVLPQYAPTVLINQGCKLYGGTNTVAFVSNITLNGGVIDLTNGATTGGFNTNLCFVGKLTVGGSSILPSTISTSGTGGNATASLGSVGLPGTEFQVADVTSSAAADLTVSSILRDVLNLVSPLTKTGPGTMSLTGANTYTGDTTVSAGTLVVSGNSIVDTNKLVLNGGKLDLSANETVGSLFYAGSQQAAGTYGSSDSSATVKDNSRFSGTGVLTVTTGSGSGVTYESWASIILNPNDRDRTDDADGDGFLNIDEFLFGTSPVASTGSLAQFERSGSNLIVRWNQRATGSSVYALKQSTTLIDSPWPVSPATISNNPVQDVPDYIRKQAVIPVDSARKFVRVEATE